mgnify:CR=1 FL=1
MIISKTPFRISFFGGGTDYPVWFKKNSGAVLGTTINQYGYIIIRVIPEIFEKDYVIVYREREYANKIEQITHPSVRECLKFTNIHDKIELHYLGDLPARSGLGSSSTFTVGCLNALYTHKNLKASKHLYVFQRTPSSVDFRGNRPTDSEWVEALEPGWHKERMENFNNLVSGVPQEVDLVDDCWTDLIGNIADMYRRGAVQPEMDLLEVLEMANFEKMESIRKRVEENIEDPKIAEALKPWYALFCKRPCFDDEYLPTFNRENVDLIDTGGLGVDEITAKGVVVAEKEYEVDCIIFATGFEVGTGYERRAGCQVIGEDGRTLTEKWDDKGVSTLHGLQTRGYPNYFMLSPNQGAFTVNFPHLLEEAATNAVHIIKHMFTNDHSTVDVEEEAEEQWVQTIIQKARGPIGAGPGSTECTPGYYNNEGHLNEKSRQGAPYGGGSIEFFHLMEKWRESGDFKGLKFN